MSRPVKEVSPRTDVEHQLPMDIVENKHGILQEISFLYQAIEEVLLQIGYWKVLKERCLQYSHKIRMGQIQDMYRFEVVVELSSICDVSCPLATKIIYELKAATLLFENVIFNKIKLWDLMEHDIVRDQMYVVLRVQGRSLNLPLLKEKELCASQNQFVFYQGLVNSWSKPITYLQSTRYDCCNSDCRKLPTYYRRVHFNIGYQDICQCDYRCTFCSSQMTENKNFRILGTKLCFNAKCLKPLHKDESAVNRPSLLCCRDELIKDVKLARRYTFTGIITFCFIQNKYVSVFEVISMVPIMDFPSQPMLMGDVKLLKDIYEAFMDQTEDENNNMCGIIPVNKQQSENEASKLWINVIYPDLNISSWQFVFNLVKTFAPTIAPANTYFGLKLLTLLTMAQTSSGEEHVAPLSFCVSGSDTGVINDIFRYAGIFCPYCVHHSNTLQLFPSMTVSDSNKVNVGSFLWTNYIYIFKDLDMCNFNKNDFTLLTNVLENGKVILDFGPEHKSSKGCVDSQTTSIWASIQRNNRKLRMLANCSRHSSVSVKDQKLDQLVNSFNLFFQIDAWDSQEIAGILAQNTLFHACNKEAFHPKFSSAQWTEYFDSVRNWRVTMSDKAMELVHKYYVKRRLFSEESGKLASFPSSLMQTLITLSSSFAKLAFASAVDISHVVVAIILVEENLLVRTGTTPPFPSVIKQNVSVKVTSLFYESQLDEIMKNFEDEIMKFVSYG